MKAATKSPPKLALWGALVSDYVGRNDFAPSLAVVSTWVRLRNDGFYYGPASRGTGLEVHASYLG